MLSLEEHGQSVASELPGLMSKPQALHSRLPAQDFHDLRIEPVAFRILRQSKSPRVAHERSLARRSPGCQQTAEGLRSQRARRTAPGA